MKNVLKSMTLLALAVAIAAPMSAQEKKKKKEKGGNPLAQTVAKVKDAGADEATVNKVEALAKEYGPKLMEARKGLGDAQKQIAEARKAAAADGKKGKDLQAAVDAAVTLTDEQKAALKKSQELQQEFNAAVAKLLTPEQAKAAGVAGRGDGKKKKKNENE